MKKKILLKLILTLIIAGFCFQVNAADKKKVIFVTQGDSLFMDALSKKGYDVTKAYPGTEGWDFSKLNFADIVVVGRSMNSGDFKDVATWSKVEAPVLFLSAPAARSNRLKLFKSSEHNDFTFASATDTLWAKFADTRDPIVKGFKLNADAAIDFSTATQSLVKYGADSLERTSSAKLLATAIAPDTLGGNRVLACRWKAGVETYEGSGMAPASIWSYIAISGFALTDNGLQMCVNEMETLLKMSQTDKKKIVFVTRADSLFVDAFMKEGYDVTVSYPGTEGWDFSKLNFTDLVVVGRDMNSGDFKDIASWSKVEVPVLFLSAPGARSNRIKLFNSSVHNDFVFETPSDVLLAKFADTRDPITKGLMLNADSTIDFSMATHSLVKYGADSLEATSSAKLLATAIAPDTLGGNRVLACRFPAGEETYPGSAMVPASEWSYIAISGFSNTRNGLEICFNEAENLLRRASNSSKKVIFVTKDDDLYKNTLMMDGYDVQVMYPGDGTFDFSKLNFADLVVVGRSMNSGDFKDVASWSKVEAPVIFLSAPAARNNRLKLFNSNTHNDFTFASPSGILFAKFKDATDPMAKDLDLDAQNMIDYSTATHSLVQYGADSLEATTGAILIATAIAPDSLGGGWVLACRFPAGVETYPGSGMTPVSTWTYLAVSGSSSTSNGLQMLLNEAEANTMQDESTKEIIFVSRGDSLYVDALIQEGHNVTVMYPGDGSFSYSKLNFANVVVIGRDANSADFKDFESWSKVKPPVFSLGAPLMRNSRLKMFNSGTHTDYTFASPSDILYAKFADATDPMANDLALDAEKMIGYSTGTHSLVQYGADSLEATSSAKLIATAIAPDSLGGGRVLACRWEAGVETYPGSGMIPTSVWSYMAISDKALTENGIKMMLNEVANLAKQYEIPDVVPVNKIEISSEGNVNTLEVGETLNFYATIYPADASNQDIVWTVSDGSLASINQNGLLTAIKASGFLPVTIRATNSDGITGSFGIFIKPAIKLVESVLLTSEGDVSTLAEEKTLQILAAIMPADATNQDLVWSVSDESLATIDQNGLLTAVKASETPVTVTATSTDGIIGTIAILITSKVAVNEFGFEKTRLYYNSIDDMLVIENSTNVESVELFSIAGKKIMFVEANKQERIQINTSTIKSGVYLVRMKFATDIIQGAKFTK